MTSLSARRRHPMAGLFVVLLGLLVVGGAYAAFLSPSAGRAAAAPATSFAVQEGKNLFLEGCSTCHGLNAEGTTDGPTLIGVGAAAVDFQVGTGRMPLQAPGAQAPRKPTIYSDAETQQLAAYIASLAPGPAIPAQSDLDYADADLAQGGELFRTNCASCHSFTGRGGALTNGKYAPSLGGASPKHIYEAMVSGPQAMPVFGDGSITPEQKQSIIRYVKHIDKQPNPGGLSLGQVGPVSEGLFVWIVGIGSLIAVAVWLGSRVT